MKAQLFRPAFGERCKNVGASFYPFSIRFFLLKVSKCVRDLAEVIFIQRVTAPALAVVLPILSLSLSMNVPKIVGDMVES